MSKPVFSIEPVQLNTEASAAYCRLRRVMWPMDEKVCESEVAEILSSPRWRVLVARLDNGAIAGFVEAGFRDFAEGAESSPVGYLEGLYVLAEYRRHGIGKALVCAGEQWLWSQGCTEIASDAQIDNAISIELHKRLGYAEVERQVCFLKKKPAD
jgi:aminoglycoside 6'-N-acetyltransferase I